MQAKVVAEAGVRHLWPMSDCRSDIIQEFSQYYPGQAITKDVFARILREVDPSMTMAAVDACICEAKLSEHDLIDFVAFFSWLFSPKGEPRLSADAERLCSPGRESVDDATSLGTPDVPEVDSMDAEEQRRHAFRMCCSGRSFALNAQQTRMALAAFGLFPALQDVVVRSGIDGLEEDNFVAYVDDLQRAGCATGPCVLPVALRGVTLRQVQDVLATFVASGWLAMQCEARGSPEASSGEEGCLSCHEDAHALNDLVVQPLTSVDPQLRQHIPAEWRPADPLRDCSYAELVNPAGLAPHIFISHCWDQPFAKTVGALAAASSQLQSWAGVAEAEELAVWMSLFGLSQHDDGDAGCCDGSPVFRAAMEHASCGVAMVVDEDMRVFNRLWCLYEAYEANAMDKDFELVLDPAFEMEGGGHARVLVDQLHILSGFHAMTGCVEDKTAIWMAVANARSGGSASAKMAAIGNELDLSYCLPALSVFDVQVCQIISSPLLRRSLRLFDGTSALRCISLGADCGRDELMAVATMDGDLSMVLHPRFAREGCDLAHVLSYFGRGDALSFFLEECGASACVAAPDGSTPLHWAAAEGQLEVSAMLLAHGALVSAADWEGKTPLLTAVEGGHLGVVSLLLDRLASPCEEDSCGLSALHLASSDGHVDMVSLLIQHNASVHSVAMGWTPLHHAAFQGHRKVSKLLLAARADAELADEDGLMPLHFAADAGHVQVAAALLESGAAPDVPDGEGKRPLHKAAFSGHERIAALLFEYAASVHSVDSRQESALHKAAFAGHSHIVKFLLRCRADTGERNSVGWTPLHRAVSGSHVEAVGVLLQHCAPVETCDVRQKTPLHKAAFLGNSEIVGMLLEYRASVDEKDMRGETPLHKAAFAGHTDIILQLLDHGAAATVESKQGKTPLHRCAGAGHLDATEILVLAEWMALSAVDLHGDTPWMRAQFFGHRDVLNLLLDFAGAHQ